MVDKSTIARLICFTAIIVGAIVGFMLLYKYATGSGTIQAEINETGVRTKVETLTEKTRAFEKDEHFDGIITEIHNGLKRVGNLSYHNHFTNLQHEKGLREIEEHNSTIRIGLIVSGVLIITVILALGGYLFYRYKTGTHGVSNGGHGHRTVLYGAQGQNGHHGRNNHQDGGHGRNHQDGGHGRNHQDGGHKRYNDGRVLPQIPDDTTDSVYSINIDPLFHNYE